MEALQIVLAILLTLLAVVGGVSLVFSITVLADWKADADARTAARWILATHLFWLVLALLFWIDWTLRNVV